jgi:hypothetical protein
MSNHNFVATPTINGTEVEWQLCYINTGQCGDGKTTPYPDVTLKKNGGAAHFTFTIEGDTGILFAPNPPSSDPNPPADKPGPIWVHQKGEGNGPGVHAQVRDVQGAGTNELKFKDKNDRPNFFHPKAITLKYQLNFVDAQGKPVTSLDPDIKNGGKTFLAFSAPVAAAIGAALAIILLVVWWKQLRPRRNPVGPGSNPGS